MTTTTTPLAIAARALIDAYGGNVPDWLREEVAAIETALALPTPPIRVVVGLDGGLIQWAIADREGVDVTTVDFDVEGVTDFVLTLVPSFDGRSSDPASVGGPGVDVDAAYVDRLAAAPYGVDSHGDFYGDDGEDQEEAPDKWMVSGEYGVPGPEGGIEAYSGWFPAYEASEATDAASAFLKREHGEDIRIFSLTAYAPTGRVA